jgi:hypothetical protein
MADPDFFMCEGDSLPLVDTVLEGSDELPIDLTGCTVTFERAPAEGGTVVVRPVTINPDQVGHKGAVTLKVFDRGTSTRGFYEGRFVVVDGSGEQISIRNDRPIVIEVTRKPGS